MRHTRRRQDVRNRPGLQADGRRGGHVLRRGVARVRLACAWVVVGAVVLAACGGKEPATTEPKAATTVTAAPKEVVAESTWSRGRMKISFPDELAVVRDAVYVKTDDGHVVRINPATRTVGADVRIDTTTNPDEYCQGLGSDGQTLWACSAAGDGTTDVVRLDPDTLEVLATVKVDKIFDQLTLPLSEGTLWVLSGTGDTLTAVDTASNRTTAHPLGRSCLQAAATARVVYLTCLLSDEVLAVDTTTGKIIDKAAVADPVNVVADDEDVWVSGAEGIVRFSPDLDPRSVYPGLVAGREGDLLLTEDALWIRQGPEFLSRIDTATDAVAARYAIDPVPSGGSLVAIGDEVWTTAYDDDLVLMVDAAG
jgi:outer membrane protein assembly factor BamB